jgi:hypothetical protein
VRAKSPRPNWATTLSGARIMRACLKGPWLRRATIPRVCTRGSLRKGVGQAANSSSRCEPASRVRGLRPHDDDALVIVPAFDAILAPTGAHKHSETDLNSVSLTPTLRLATGHDASAQGLSCQAM